MSVLQGAVAGTGTMDTSIFDAFPNAIISGVWEIGTCQHGTVVGNTYTKIADLNVIVDEGSNSSVNNIPETLASDFLIYAMPCQVLNIDTNELVSNYMLHNSQNGGYYEIIDAGIGKNQHTGNIEHLELKVVRTEVTNG